MPINEKMVNFFKKCNIKTIILKKPFLLKVFNLQGRKNEFN